MCFLCFLSRGWNLLLSISQVKWEKPEETIIIHEWEIKGDIYHYHPIYTLEIYTLKGIMMMMKDDDNKNGSLWLSLFWQKVRWRPLDKVDTSWCGHNGSGKVTSPKC